MIFRKRWSYRKAWRKVIGLRNALAHEYGRIDHRRLFFAATEDTAALSRLLEVMLANQSKPEK